MLTRLLVVSVVTATALVVATAVAASVRKVTFTASMRAGDDASLTVRVSPRARCTITVVYDTTVSHARGLGAKTGTVLTWRWRVGTSTHRGRWPVTVSCGKAGRLRLVLRVLAGS